MGTKLPLALEAILREFGFTPDEAIVRNHARRQKQDLLPDDSIYFSEQALRSRFDNATKELVKGIDGFDYVPNQDGTYLMYYRSHHGPAPECLTEYGTCGSFGVVMQFLIRLRELGYRSCFLLSPHECTSAMHAAALASTEGYELPLWLCVATGIGGEGEEFDETWAPEPSTVTFCPRDR